METTKAGFALGVIRGLQRRGIGESVYLRGSLARGQGDMMSDIDIGVRDERLSDQTLAALVIAHMEQNHEVLFYDWAKSLLPDQCVLTFFFQDLPLFWSIDFELSVNPGQHVLSRNRVTNDRRDHLLKLWIMTAKHFARGSEAASDEVDRLYAKAVEGGAKCAGDLPKFRRVLETIMQDAPAAYAGLVEQCRQFQGELEKNGGPNALSPDSSG